MFAAAFERLGSFKILTMMLFLSLAQGKANLAAPSRCRVAEPPGPTLPIESLTLISLYSYYE